MTTVEFSSEKIGEKEVNLWSVIIFLNSIMSILCRRAILFNDFVMIQSKHRKPCKRS